MRDARWLAAAVIRGSLRDRRGLIPTLLTPLLILLAFWYGAGREPQTIASLFAACVGLSVTMAGSAHATRLVSWREQGVLQRLACTPLPIVFHLFGIGLGQVVFGILQGLIILLFGITVLGLHADPVGALWSVAVLTLGAMCFVAYGSLVAQIANHTDGANAIFVFSVLPMFFLGGGIPSYLLPLSLRVIGGLTPAGMIAGLLNPLIASGSAVGWLIPLAGLIAYTIVFSALAARLFRLD